MRFHRLRLRFQLSAVLSGALALSTSGCFNADRAAGDPFSPEGLLQELLISGFLTGAATTPTFWANFSYAVSAPDGGTPYFLGSAGFTARSEQRYYLYRNPFTAPQVMQITAFNMELSTTTTTFPGRFFAGIVRDASAVEGFVFTTCPSQPCTSSNASTQVVTGFSSGADATPVNLPLPHPIGAATENLFLPGLTNWDSNDGALFNVYDGSAETAYLVSDLSSPSPTVATGGGACRSKDRYQGFAICDNVSPQYYDSGTDQYSNWVVSPPANAFGPVFIGSPGRTESFYFADNGGLELYRFTNTPSAGGTFSQITPVPSVTTGAAIGVEARHFTLGNGTQILVFSFFDSASFENEVRVWRSGDGGASYTAGLAPGTIEQQALMLPRNFYVDSNGELRVITVNTDAATQGQLRTFSTTDGNAWTEENFTPPAPISP